MEDIITYLITYDFVSIKVANIATLYDYYKTSAGNAKQNLNNLVILLYNVYLYNYVAKHKSNKDESSCSDDNSSSSGSSSSGSSSSGSRCSEAEINNDDRYIEIYNTLAEIYFNEVKEHNIDNIRKTMISCIEFNSKVSIYEIETMFKKYIKNIYSKNDIFDILVDKILFELKKKYTNEDICKMMFDYHFAVMVASKAV